MLWYRLPPLQARSVPVVHIHHVVESVWSVESWRLLGLQSWNTEEFVSHCTWAKASRGLGSRKEVWTIWSYKCKFTYSSRFLNHSWSLSIQSLGLLKYCSLSYWFLSPLHFSYMIVYICRHDCFPYCLSVCLPWYACLSASCLMSLTVSLPVHPPRCGCQTVEPPIYLLTCFLSYFGLLAFCTLVLPFRSKLASCMPFWNSTELKCV